MSWKCSRHYWSLGCVDVHVFTHALDDYPQPLYARVCFGRWFGRWLDWWVWPLRDAEARWHAHVMPGAPSRVEYDARRSA